MRLIDAIVNNEQLPPEEETGNVEYKLLLHNHQPDRLEHYLSQLKWRLAEHRHCTYMIGVEDNGSIVGTRRAVFDETITVLREMVKRASGELVVKEYEVSTGRWCAECEVTCGVDSGEADRKVLVAGKAGTGKSTLIGVLQSRKADNGRGSSRISTLRHRHELLSGVTQSRSYHYITTGSTLVDDFDLFGVQSVTDHGVVQMIDTPGFPSLTSMACLTSLVRPDLVLLVRLPDDGDDGEFERVCHFLSIPCQIIYTHSTSDAPNHVDLTSTESLSKLDKILSTVKSTSVSNGTGAKMTIEQVYFGDQIGLIVSGLVLDGPFNRHQRVTLQPLDTPVVINSIHRMRSQVHTARPGQYVTFSLSVPDGVILERGHQLVADSTGTGTGTCIMTNSVKIGQKRYMSRRTISCADLPLHGTVLVNGAKYSGQLLDTDTIVLTMRIPIHQNAPIIFISTADHFIFCAFTT